MKVLRDLEQGKPAWWNIRRGIPTASNFSRIITPAEEKYAAAAGTYMDELIAAVLDPQPKFQGSADTDRGHRLEAPALRWLRYEHKIETEKVGFVLSDCETYGCSPDALVCGTTIPVEVKAPDIHTFFGWRREVKKSKEIPRLHKVQVHGEMFTCEADHAYFVAYAEHPCVEPFMMRVERSSFTDKIGPFLERFTKELRDWEEEVLGEHLAEYRDGLAKGRSEALALTGKEAA